MVKVVVINGFPRSGKDEFMKQCAEILGNRCDCCSAVDFVKELATHAGWKGNKTPKNRKFLSDLKDLLANWNDIPFKKMEQSLKSFQYEMSCYGLNGLFFLVSREPDEIKRLQNELGAKSLLLRRFEVEDNEQSNHADAEVLNYNYDYIIYNNGTIEDLKKAAEEFIEKIFESEE